MKPIKELLIKPHPPYAPTEPSATHNHEELEEVCEISGMHGSSIGHDVFDLAEIFAHEPGANLAELSVMIQYNGDYDTTLLVGKVKKTVKENKSYDAQMKRYLTEKRTYEKELRKYEERLKAYDEQQAELERTKQEREIKAALTLLKKHGYIQG